MMNRVVAKIVLILTAVSVLPSSATEDHLPCSEISRDLRLPCKCALGPIETALDGNPSIDIDCNGVVFANDIPIPYGAPVVTFSQRRAGQQSLPSHLFLSSGLPLRKVDFTGNALRRITEKLLTGLQDTLIELRLADNLLGDTLNPIFSTSELHSLKHLQVLDLSGNEIKTIEEGIFEGCDRLQELYLDRNSLYVIPSTSLNGPRNLKVLSLSHNRIPVIGKGAFESQLNLEEIDVSHNLISTVDGGCFERLEKLKVLKLSYNRLTKFNSDVFQGADNLNALDLSQNFIAEFPSVALKVFANLHYLNLSSNLIQNLDNNNLAGLTNLYDLDLSRNNIANIVPGTFLGLRQLRRLDISVNSLRTIEDDAFEGLDNLKYLNLKDNNILLIPASALGRLPHLTALKLDYNRIAALSGDILRSIAERVTSLDISKNVVRELPADTFQYFQHLEHLDLTRNLISTINTEAFNGLEETLLSLRLSQNRIVSIVGQPLSLLKLKTLDLSDNQLNEFERNAFTLLPDLEYLNLSGNPLTNLHPSLVHKLNKLKTIDMTRTQLKLLTVDFFMKSPNMENIYLNDNELTEIVDGTFMNMKNLTVVDLTNNKISNIKPGSFVNVMNMKKLLLSGNQLTSFKGEFFNTGTSLEVLDISNNQLSYLFPSSFKIHPRLREISAKNNMFNFFPSELIGSLQYLETIDLSGNHLKAIEELDFARLPRLHTLLLAHNEIDEVNEMSFHNSTQLQVLDLSYNKLDRLSDRTFEGLIRMETLNLEGNLFSDLPESIFERSRLQMLENINLARNKFEVAPLKSLQRQYFFVSSVDLSHNMLKDIPAEDSIMVNIKKLDLSFNPLTEQAIRNVLSEPKTVRDLNLAGTGIRDVAQLETPFLNSLNVSHNNITTLDEKTFARTTLLETLDVSYNNIEDLTDLRNVWPLLKNIQSLNISGNPIIGISEKDLDGLLTLKRFSVHDLRQCVRIEKNAFKNLRNLSYLDAYNYPKLGYIDIKGLLKNAMSVEEINIETKDSSIGSDQLRTILNPRLRELGIWGSRLRSVSSGTLSGLKGDHVTIRLRNTSITILPPAIFFPVPRSSHVSLDVAGSQLTTLNPQLLTSIDDRRGDLKILGLETNPLVCDCGARALRRWLPAHMAMVKCTAPKHLQGKLLAETADDELTCDTRKLSTLTSTMATAYAKTNRPNVKITEPDIIWSLAPTEKNGPVQKVTNTGQSSMGNDDTLIIGIVGGVVAFIAILIIVICIIRLRINNNQFRANNANALGQVMNATGSSCACSIKGTAPLYALPPSYGASYSATLPKMQMHTNMTAVQSLRPTYSTLGRGPYYQNNGQPYFIAYSSDEKIYR